MKRDYYYVKIGKGENNKVYHVRIIKGNIYNSTECEIDKREETLVFTGTLIDCYAYIKLAEGHYL